MKHKLQNGMTLVELLVAMVIGLVVTIVVTTLLISGENHKRTTTSTNDAEQTGSYAFHALDHVLRNAGSGIAESASGSGAGAASAPPVGLLGCKLNATYNGAVVLPHPGPFPTPFATAFLGGAPNNLRLAPLLIANGKSDGGSDVLVVMGGSGAAGGVSRQINGAGGAGALILENTVGFNPSDLVLVSQGSTPGVTDCLLEEVTQVNSPNLTLAGGANYYTTASATTDLTTLSNSTFSYVTPIGNAAANNVQFELFGVGIDNTLYSYDLLQNQQRVQGIGGDTSQAIADGVVQLKALYGLQATAKSGVLSSWASPVAPYDIDTVMTTPATQQLIVAVHVALVVRGEYFDKNEVAPATLTLFNGFADAGGNSLAQVINLTALDPNGRHYRYRVFEFTVPLRNMLLLSKG
jgi:type IV pilus assembly protein PilW